jgi:hypothetical protein
MRAGFILALLTAAAVAAAGRRWGNGASPATTSTSSGAAASTSSAPPSSVALAEPKLPAIQSMAKAGGVAIKASHEADWTLVAHSRAWVAGLGKGVGVYDARAGALCPIDPAGNRLVGCTVIDPAGVDGGDLTVGNGFVWFRGTEALVAQVDPKSGRVVRRIGTGEGSGSTGAGSGQLWISAHDMAKLYRVPVR